jgi:hypothetical protein
MRRILLLPLILFSLALASCAGIDKSVFDGGLSITATVQNPVTREQQAAVEASYQVAVSAALAYSRLRRCKAGEVFSATNPCSQWPTVQKLKLANRKAYKQLVNLRSFMDKNQQVSAVAAFNALQAALRDFKAIASGV